MTDDPLWETRDGRALKLQEMFPGHISNAQVVLRKWAKQERDPEVKKDLKSWLKRFRKEQTRRVKEWRARRENERR